MHARASKDRKRPFGLPLATLRLLQRAGYIGSVTPDYTFSELILLRTVSAMRAARVPARMINRALRELAPTIKEASPGRISWNIVTGGLGVHEGRAIWEPGSGQYLLPLERAEITAQVVAIDRHEKMPENPQRTAEAHYLRAADLEHDDRAAARAAYEACLAADRRHADARINLGRLLHLSGLLQEAERIYQGYEEPSAILFFNFATLLEDLEREAEAIESYRKALIHDPGMADAHFNLSLLYERLGESKAAFRHLLAYRRLVEARQPAPEGGLPPADSAKDPGDEH